MGVYPSGNPDADEEEEDDDPPLVAVVVEPPLEVDVGLHSWPYPLRRLNLSFNSPLYLYPFMTLLKCIPN